MCISNISYYIYLQFDDLEYPLTVINLFSFPDATLLSQSSQTVYLCNSLEGQDMIRVIPIMSIKSVVSMFPDLKVMPDGKLVDMQKFALLRHLPIHWTHKIQYRRFVWRKGRWQHRCNDGIMLFFPVNIYKCSVIPWKRTIMHRISLTLGVRSSKSH